MEAREIIIDRLGEFQTHLRAEERLERRIILKEERKVSLASPVIDGLPKSTVSKTLADYAAELEEMEEELERIRADKKDAYKFILKAIRLLPGDDEKDVIDLKYIAGLSYKAIGLKLHYSKSNAKRIHDKALDRLCTLMADGKL